MSVRTQKGNGPKAKPATKQQQQLNRGIAPLMLQALAVTASDEKEWNQDELLDTVYWMRQLIAVLCGIIWGGIPLTGLPAFLGFLAVKFGVLIVWLQRAGVDVDEHGGAQMVYSEGLPPAIGLFTLVWIVTYTLLHS